MVNDDRCFTPCSRRRFTFSIGVFKNRKEFPARFNCNYAVCMNKTIERVFRQRNFIIEFQRHKLYSNDFDFVGISRMSSFTWSRPIDTYLGATFSGTSAGDSVRRRQGVELLPFLHLLRRLTKRHCHRHRVHFKQHRTAYLRFVSREPSLILSLSVLHLLSSQARCTRVDYRSEHVHFRARIFLLRVMFQTFHPRDRDDLQFTALRSHLCDPIAQRDRPFNETDWWNHLLWNQFIFRKAMRVNFRCTVEGGKSQLIE